MIPISTELSAPDAALLLVLLAAGSFAVSWMLTEVVPTSRRRYVAFLAIATAAAAGGTAWWTSASMDTMVTDHATSGLVGGEVTGALAGFLLRRLQGTHRLHGRDLVKAEVWEGLVYGVAEGVLLSGLPAFVAWQMADSLGWSTVASWVFAMGASAVVIAVHHLGYWDYRGRKVIPPVIACSVLTVGYLATGSLVAPALGHVILHLVGITKGIELPPHRRPSVGTHALAAG